ncbi:MAG: DUF1059 domain-containing protein [Actinomycetota bacterium]|nr:DUF1059 domain-containing protein [Actinomycetota bacterium]
MSEERVERVIRCDCGFEAASDVDADLVERAQAHARQTHGSEVSADLILSLARPRTPTEPTTEG